MAPFSYSKHAIAFSELEAFSRTQPLYNRIFIRISDILQFNDQFFHRFYSIFTAACSSSVRGFPASSNMSYSGIPGTVLLMTFREDKTNAEPYSAGIAQKSPAQKPY
ncbi:hypothetical protein [Klebsiella pneumoniae]|uniref:hypothetical protein n=1 Tax=Klebsiella pneumoniae TaxID=573 RepID=UPI002948F310|nr:hypothetical protein [Klebsiella pneumoniae]MDV5501095.1 hypothetical protein [Klebsiella pneumoniae]